MSESVFISHAVDDRSLVDPLQELLALGVGLNPTEIFYSSGAGTGIPAGKNFVQHIRDEMKGASFVVAVITPNSLASEFWMAELGAVWYASDKEFFPLCTPDVDRASLRATLTGIQVEKVDDAAALAGLLQRLCDHFGRDHVAASCTARIGIFLKELPSILDKLSRPQLVPAAELEDLEKVNEELLESLARTRGELGESEKRLKELFAAKTSEEIAAVKRPGDLEGQIAELLKRSKAAVRKLTPGVRRSLPFQLRGEPAPWPEGGSYEHGYVREAVEAGFLVDGDEAFLDLNTQWPDISTAVDTLEELQQTLAELDEDGEAWFVETYSVPPDLTQAAAFDELL